VLPCPVAALDQGAVRIGRRHHDADTSAPDEKRDSAVAFLIKTAVAYYRGLGVTVTHVMTDNGSCYLLR
jgi:hypothetical protein